MLKVVGSANIFIPGERHTVATTAVIHDNDNQSDSGSGNVTYMYYSPTVIYGF